MLTGWRAGRGFCEVLSEGQQKNNESNVSALNPGRVPGVSTPAKFILKRQRVRFLVVGLKKVKRAFP